MISSKKIGFSLLGCAVITPLVILAIHNIRANNTSKLSTNVLSASSRVLNDHGSGVGISITDTFVQESLSDEDKNNGFIFRLTSSDPPILVSLKIENQLRSLAVLTKQEIVPLVTSNAKRSLPTRYPDYQEHGVEFLKVNGKESAVIEFSYKGPSGQRARQALYIVKKDDDSVLYVSFQTEDSSFNELSTVHLMPLIKSIVIKQ